ncbi:MAG: hypothetical protein IT257_02940 [Chitinophagaceae bacterium]|nr:hypothetical protein [Chitinophagaceae bacterium]
MKWFYLSFMFLISTGICAQPRFVSFAPVADHESLILNKLYADSSDTFQISTLKFYISHVTLKQKGIPVFQDDQRHHLLDVADTSTCRWMLNVPQNLAFDTISFEVGIDSITNAAGALGGDLDPTKGMYWTWQNGYINFKIEGRSSKSTARNGMFEFHIGGYNAPYSTLQQIYFPVNRQTEVLIYLNVAALLSKIDLTTLHHIMMPGPDAHRLSTIIGNLFSIQNQ